MGWIGTETLTITRGLSHQFNGLSSAYASRPQGENTATNYTEHVGTLDYIWYNPALQVCLPSSTIHPAHGLVSWLFQNRLRLIDC